MLVKRINKSKKAKIKQCCTTKLNSTNSLVPQQRRHKYFDGFPMQLLFVLLFSSFKYIQGKFDLPKSVPDRQVFKNKNG